jgi:hypothetical protein
VVGVGLTLVAAASLYVTVARLAAGRLRASSASGAAAVKHESMTRTAAAAVAGSEGSRPGPATAAALPAPAPCAAGITPTAAASGTAGTAAWGSNEWVWRAQAGLRRGPHLAWAVAAGAAAGDGHALAAGGGELRAHDLAAAGGAGGWPLAQNSTVQPGAANSDSNNAAVPGVTKLPQALPGGKSRELGSPPAHDSPPRLAGTLRLTHEEEGSDQLQADAVAVWLACASVGVVLCHWACALQQAALVAGARAMLAGFVLAAALPTLASSAYVLRSRLRQSQCACRRRAAHAAGVPPTARLQVSGTHIEQLGAELAASHWPSGTERQGIQGGERPMVLFAQETHRDGGGADLGYLAAFCLLPGLLWLAPRAAARLGLLAAAAPAPAVRDHSDEQPGPPTPSSNTGTRMHVDIGPPGGSSSEPPAPSAPVRLASAPTAEADRHADMATARLGMVATATLTVPQFAWYAVASAGMLWDPAQARQLELCVAVDMAATAVLAIACTVHCTTLCWRSTRAERARQLAASVARATSRVRTEIDVVDPFALELALLAGDSSAT